jgi:hypothetical protein
MSGTLPDWLERLLGVETSPGEGTAWGLDYRWPLPSWLTLVLAAAVVVFVVLIYLRESRTASARYRLALAGVRLALVALLAGMISQASLSLRRTGLPYVGVVLDDSQSMGIVDRYEGRRRDAIDRRVEQALGSTASLSRWDLARTLLEERDGAMLEKLAGDYKLRLYLLTGMQTVEGEQSRAILDALVSAEPLGEATRLGAGVMAVLDDLRGAAPAAVVVFTDGINTEGPPLAEAAAAARRRGVPLLFVGLGSDQPVRDLQLADLLADEVVFLGDVANFEAKLTGTGFQGKQVAVRLRRADRPEPLAEIEATVGPDGHSQPVRVPYRPTEPGRFEYVLEVEPQEDELQTENNVTRPRAVEVRKDRIRVLLVQAYPNYEFRFLRTMLGRDETIELHTVLQEADLGYAEQDAAALRVFPVSRDELFSYDVIVLGDVNPALLSPAVIQNLADFVDQPGKGGALALLAGPRYMPHAWRETPLARLMPFDPGPVRLPGVEGTIEEGFTVAATELGLASPGMQLGDTPAETRRIWTELAPLYWFAEAGEVKPGARVLAEHPTRLGPDGRPLPIIAMQYVGAGKVLWHATDETWRWRFRGGEPYFARYWVQTLRYLARSKLAEGAGAAVLSTDQPDYRRGEPVRLRLRFADERAAPAADDGVTVVLEPQGMQMRRVTLVRSGTARGVFEAVLGNLPVGSYRAWVAVPAIESGAPATDFTIKPPAGEFERVRMDAAAMQQAARQTGGAFYTFENAHRLLGDLPPGRQVPIETLPPRPLWNRWPVLAVFLALLVGEWVLRKTGGMV